MNRVRTTDENKQAARDQLAFIQNSSSLFDNGHEIEALRISTCINILLNDGKNKGLLQKLNFKGSILSTVLCVNQINLDKLKINPCSSLQDMDTLINKECSTNFNLYFIIPTKEWYLFTKDKNGVVIKCRIEELAKQLEPTRQMKLVFESCLQSKNSDGNITDECKEIIVRHLDGILGFNELVPSLFFPMVSNKSVILNKGKITRYISHIDWFNETIFAIDKIF
ncbi:hypothetical protein [Legionella sp.]|uniref:hypothetical protein n=1 Tax=Legionella sp. TaxID=459 RepID=UPI00321FF10E